MKSGACTRALSAFGAGLFGLLLGSLLFGPIADAIGRKRVLLVAVLVFGGCTLASAYTQSIESLTLLRFITGIGLGARYRPALLSARSTHRRAAAC